MRIKLYKTHFWFLFPVLFVILLLASCKNITKELAETKRKGAILENGYTDFEGARQYEFNMVKNPVTGTIPEGTYEAERAQAKEILAKQEADGIIALNTYSFQGPDNLGGRTRTLAYDVRYNGGSNRIILAGGISGGVYKSTDDGATWARKSPTGEHFSCTSLAQDTRVGFQDTWYYGVGEATGNSAGASGAFYSGNGIYKSTDNGETWARLTTFNASALETFTTAADFVNKVIVDPASGKVYAACPATIYRSIDGGTTWTTVLSGTLASSGQFTDIVSTSTGRLYASFGGTNSSTVDGVWGSPAGATSGDAVTWSRIAGAGAGGSPAGWNAEPAYGRVVLGIAPSSENLLYAMYYTSGSTACIPGSPPTGGAVEADLFRWDDIGGTWTDLSATLPNEVGCLSGNDPFAVQGGYDLVVAVKPDDATVVFIGGTNVYRSTTSGTSWVRIGGYASASTYALYSGSHPDIHSIVFQPTSSTTMLCGNDGGIQRTTANLAATVAWTPINTGYKTYQYYYVTLDPRFGNAKVMGGAQDNGSTRNTGGTGSSFESVWGGDGVSVALSGASAFEYVGSQNGYIDRRLYSTPLGTYVDDITPEWANTVVSAGLFVTLFYLDPDNTERLYYVNDDTLYRTSTASTVTFSTWSKMTGVAAAVGSANDITALATTRGTYSAATSSLFMGTSNGKVYRLDDPTGVAAGTGPVNITGGSFPVANVSSISVNPRNDDTVLVTFSSYGVTSVWWTGNANSAIPTWTSVEGALTLPSYRSSAIAVTSTGVDYFVGTSIGLYTATGLPGVTTWTQEGPSDIGNAVVSNLVLRPSDNKLLVGTHGYAMWSTFLSLPVVPVTLTEFKGTLQNKTVLLQWNTSTEVNSKQFELEKSFDGTNYRKIATIAAAGNSNTGKQYSYVDREPLTEKNYYRLRSVDIDGKYKLSNIVLIKPPGMQQDILVLGNPFKNNIQVRFVRSPEAGGELRLIDVSGRLLASQKFSQGEQQIQFTIPAGKLSKGVYMLQAVINGNKFTKQVQKE